MNFSKSLELETLTAFNSELSTDKSKGIYNAFGIEGSTKGWTSRDCKKLSKEENSIKTKFP
ncbi:hypothetical protein GCM10022292_24530 [Winogradskyella damuponensis]|uniref:Uncharacterized protein n=1 Tax=Winogradskyella damuponensis TaxID=943939 RepID=A0ABP8CXY7_9FLAO